MCGGDQSINGGIDNALGTNLSGNNSRSGGQGNPTQAGRVLSNFFNSINNSLQVMKDDATGATGDRQNANRMRDQAAQAQQNIIDAQNQKDQANEVQASNLAASTRSQAAQQSKGSGGFLNPPSAAILGVASQPITPSNQLGA